ncbi:MAG: hypothetical protein DMF77_15520 [Acidobacteria bacterium]|nr:MAG: hypothetical protein DMF77_15520 [Acidobacteriota bacterium]
MKRALSVLLFLFVALAVAAPPAPAFQVRTARYYDLQRLQDDLAVLDDSLAALPTSHPRYREFEDRASALREELVRLRDDMDRGGTSSDVSVTRDTVDRLRDRIHALHGDIDNALNRGYSGRSSRSVVLSEGTEMTVRLEQSLSSRTARVEDRFDATVARPVYVDGRIVVPDGSRVQGTVTVVERAQRPARGGRLNLSFDRLLLDDGTTADLSARIVQVKEDIGSGGTLKQGAIAAAIGGILGKVIGGTKGAIVGVLLGGAGGAISSSGDDVELPEGTVFILQLDRATSVPRQ